MPTMTVSAPRNFAVRTMVRIDRATKESMTSSAATSITIPRARYRPTSSGELFAELYHLVSDRSDWMDAIR